MLRKLMFNKLMNIKSLKVDIDRKKKNSLESNSC